MLENKVLTRFGPLFQVERIGGAFVLAALAVPEDRYEQVTTQVNALPAVAHNYRREHRLNMWFVLATETPEGIASAIACIEAETQLPVFAFPKEREYFVELKLHA
jgi:DNA-binding Lrp family transcriptional regulator